MYVCLSPHARTHHINSRTHASCQATASVDLKTDDFVQQTIRTQLKHCSIITIAHRLLTVIDYDRICVMNAGTVAEYDSPHALLQTDGSLFAALVDATGDESAAELRERAAAHEAAPP